MSESICSDQKLLFYEDKANPQSMSGAKHYHDWFEIYFMEKGSCHYFIDNKLYRVTEGDLILIPEGTLHKTKYSGTGGVRRLINCSAHFIPEGVMEQLTPHLHLYRNPGLTPAIRSLLDEIRREFQSPDSYSESILQGLLHFLFYTLARHVNSCIPTQPNHLYTERTIAYIKAHYATDISLAALAQQISISPEHLSRLFKKETGFGISEYLTMYRLQKAECMLRNAPDARICDVAYACGFNDSNYFSEKFKRIYGFPPGHLRKKHLM